MANSTDSASIQELVLAISRGSETAFEKLYFLFSEKIYHVSRRMNLSHEDAEGVVQEVFLKIWKNRTKLDPSLSINAYLIAIVRSLVIKKVKRDARFFAFRKYQIPILSQFSGADPEDELIFAEFDKLSSDVIHQLPPGQQAVFRLRYVDNLSVAEIAEQLNLSKRTVENQVFRSTRFVKEKLAKLKIISMSLMFVLLQLVRF